MKKAIALLLVLIMTVSFVSCFEEEPKEFSSDGMSITLTNRFVKLSGKEFEGFTVCYGSAEVAVLALKEPFSLQEGFGDYTLSEYAELVFKANASKKPDAVKTEDGITVMEYSFINEDENMTYRYFSAMFKAKDAFWLVQFACDEELYDGKRPQFVEWAKTVKFD